MRSATEQLGYSTMDVVSGAGHDAIYAARVAPAGMIFVPCKDGISHNEAESATQGDCAAGADVLLHNIRPPAAARLGAVAARDDDGDPDPVPMAREG